MARWTAAIALLGGLGKSLVSTIFPQLLRGRRVTQCNPSDSLTKNNFSPILRSSPAKHCLVAAVAQQAVSPAWGLDLLGAATLSKGFPQ
ncbi:MAG: hypothetical protein ACYTF0_06640 [Planctomycetota bacterium]|jgi:hypothetical protein